MTLGRFPSDTACYASKKAIRVPRWSIWVHGCVHERAHMQAWHKRRAARFLKVFALLCVALTFTIVSQAILHKSKLHAASELRGMAVTPPPMADRRHFVLIPSSPERILRILTIGKCSSCSYQLSCNRTAVPGHVLPCVPRNAQACTTDTLARFCMVTQIF